MKISETKTLIKSVIEYNIECFTRGKGHRDFVVPFLQGDPGIGKTAAPRQVGRELEIPVRTTIVAQYDAGELAGFPMPDYDQKKMIRFRPDFLPDGDPIVRDDGKGNKKTELRNPVGIWQLDELPQAPVACMNLCAQIVEEWSIGEHPVAPGWTIVCSGNKPSNRAGTNTIPTHLRDRLLHIDVETDHDEWLRHASERQLRPEITSYIKKNPASLAAFDPAARACPSPRSWFKADAVLGFNLPPHIRLPTLAGYIGEGQANQFESWLRVADRMPDPKEVIRLPDKAPLFGSKDADVLILLLANMASLATKDNIGNIIKYVNRLPNQEFSVYCLQDCYMRNPKIESSKEFEEWMIKQGAKIFE